MRSLSPFRSLPALVLALVIPSLGVAQSATRTMVLTTATDTVSVEQVTRTADRLAGELVARRAGIRWRYVAHLTGEGLVSVLESEFLMVGDGPGARPRQVARLTFTGDSVIATIDTGRAARTQRLATRSGALPWINPSFALVEQAIRRARQRGGDSVDVPGFAVSGGQTFTIAVRRLGADSAVVTIGGVAARLSVDSAGAILGGSVPDQGLRLDVRPGATDAALAGPKPDYSAPPGAPYTAEEVTVPAPGGFSLAGTLTLPRHASRTRTVPAVVTITGSGPQDRDEALPIVPGYRPFRELADSLGRRGIAVLRLDDRGVFRSGGNAARATTADFADDIRAALAWLRNRPEIDGSRLALVGHSEGGIIAPMIAATDSALAGIVLLAAPSRTGRHVVEYQNRAAVERDSTIPSGARDSVVAAAMRQLESVAETQPWVRFFLDYDPVTTAKRVRVPVLILQGETDRQVTQDQAGELAAAFRAGGNRDVTVQVFPATNHLFMADPDGNPARYASLGTRSVRPQVMTMIADWLVTRLRPRRHRVRPGRRGRPAQPTMSPRM